MRSSASAGKPVATREGAVLAILDRLMDGTPIELEVQGDEGAGSRRSVDFVIEGDRRALTEPGALHVGPRLRLLVSRPSRPRSARSCRAARPSGRACRSATASSSVAGQPVADFPAMVKIVQPSPGKTLTFVLDRKGERLEVPIEVEAQRDGDRMIGRIGIQPVAGLAVPEEHEDASSVSGRSLPSGRAVEKTWDMSVLTIRMIWNVATGDVSVKNLSGPINIAEYAGFSARQGILSFLSFLAVVSVSLFVLNLLPIPILDGGQVVYQLAEVVKGSPLSERAQAVGQQIGILLLLMLMSFAFYNDLSRLFS